MIKKRWQFLLAAFSCLVLATGCNGTEMDMPEDSQSAAERVVISSTEDFERLEKQNAYIALFNGLSGDFYQAQTDYRSIFGWEPQLNTQSPQVPQALNGFAELLKDSRAFIEAAPAVPEMDRLVEELLDLLEQYCQVWEEAFAYYQNQTYLEDDFKQGQIYHTDLLNRYNELYPLLAAFEEQIVELDAVRRGETIAYCEAEGLLIEYHLLHVIQTTGELGRMLRQIPMEMDEELEQQNISLEEFQVYYDDLTGHISGFHQAVSIEEQVAKEYYLTEHESSADLVESLDALGDIAEQIKEQLQNGAELEGSDLPGQLEAQLYIVTECYNTMLS